jgi:hypothetical protein
MDRTMRGDSKHKLISFLCGILIAAILCLQFPGITVEAKTKTKTSAKAKAKTKAKTTLILGDSIAYGMALGKNYGTGVDNPDKVYWLAEGGVTINFIHPNFKIHLGRKMPRKVVNTLTNTRNFDLIKEVKKKKIEDIVVVLGANWPGKDAAKLTVSCLKKLAKKSGCRVYYVNILPYVHKGRYKDKSGLMVQHNNVAREGFENSGIVYIDAYNIAKSVKNYRNYTWDGIHYSGKVHNPVYKEILSEIEKNKAKLLAKSKTKKKKQVERANKVLKD